jgi:arylsulfatase A-like enzyme
MPTILDLCGFPVPEAVQGRSLRPLLEGSEDPGRPAFCEKTHSPTGRYRRMIRMGDWKCVTRMAPGRKPAFEVYNLAMDPGEEHNLADDPEHAGVREVLLAELAAWAVRTDDPWPR